MNDLISKFKLFKEKKFAKIFIISFCVLLLFNFFMVIPQIRSLVIQLLEFIFQRKTKYPASWMNKLLVYTIFIDGIYFSIISFFVFFRTNNKKIRIYFFIYWITLFFIFTNVTSTINGFIGYCNNWDFGDLLPSITTYYGPSNVPIYSTNYPPLAVLFFKFLHLFLPTDSYTNIHALNYLLTLSFIFITLSLFILFKKLFIQQDKYATIISLLLFLTGPMLFTYQRFNIIFIALLFTIFFVLYYQSNNKIVKELALISLALAANIKLYPAVFGIFLLERKQWKESLRCILYAIVFFIFPIIFKEDTATVTSLANNISSFSNVPSGISLIAILSKMGLNTTLQYCTLILYILITFLAFFITSKEYQKYLLIVLLCILVPKVSYFYLLIFLIIPFAKLLEQEYLSIFDKLIFTILTFMFVYSFNFIPILNPNNSFFLILLVFSLFIDIFISKSYCYYKNKHNTNTYE